MDNVLFQSRTGGVSAGQMKKALLSVGAADCDVLYVHSGMSFGLPALKRGQLLAELFGILCSLRVGTLVFPTFTFSFCNKEAFNVQDSPTSMGALNEYARKSGEGRRTTDPLLSVYVLGNTLNLVENLGSHSIGVDSNYDRLHNCGKEVKFLFLGADMRECFTYTHYIEAIIGVPYRYDREFSGAVTDAGETTQRRAWLYTCYANCRLNSIPVVYNAMKKCNMLRMESVGDGQICCLREKDAYTVISNLLRDNPLSLTDGSFDSFVRDTTYNPNNERIISVR